MRKENQVFCLLIQETLVLLWEKLERRFLPLSAYELLVLPRPAYGGTSTQPRTGLQVAIARRARCCFSRFKRSPTSDRLLEFSYA